MNTRELDVYLLTYDDPSITADDLAGVSPSPEDSVDSSNLENSNPNQNDAQELRKVITYESTKLWKRRDSSLDHVWEDGSASFSSTKVYSLAFAASADTRYPSHRGFAAIDNIELSDGACDCKYIAVFK